MRFLGNKESIIEEIYNIISENIDIRRQLTLFDAFCGTGTVANQFKDRFNIILNDNLKCATVYSSGRMLFNKCDFANLGFDPYDYLNNHKDIYQGFFYNNYSPANSNRMYFTPENAGRIDFFREQIELWKQGNLINEHEYLCLLASLIESVSKVANVAGVYGAFLKKWDSRALKDIEFIPVVHDDRGTENNITVLNDKIENIIQDVECDILYLDPPYTQNQYGTQYHLLETLVLYDYPSISKVTGSRPVTPMRSDWSKEYKAHILFDKVIATTNARYIVFSYNNDGIMSKDYIEAVLKRYGDKDTFRFKKINYKKYQNWKSANQKEHFEYLFFIEKKNPADVVYQSPLNYIGSKHRIVDDIKKHIPSHINTFIDSFGGGFSVGANVRANHIIYNDINFFVSDLMKELYQLDTYSFLMYMKRIEKKFDLKKDDKESYLKLRSYYNSIEESKRDPRMLLTLILYGYQQQIRFNNSHEFNNPPGIRWFNDRLLEKLISFSRHIKSKDCNFMTKDYKSLSNYISDKQTFIYLDPPYMLTTGAYNDGKRGFKGWDKIQENEMFGFLNSLTQTGSKFMLSYVIEHKGEINDNFVNWIEDNNYRLIELGDVLGISGSKRKEVLVTNYDVL